MRVIAGSARRLLLKTIDGMDTRPTTDRIKETLFNMLQQDLYGCTFLDLFAGSGAIGIEALSRGAREAVFVERSPQAVACIRDNLERTRLADRAQILSCDVFAALRRLEARREAFDFIFMDPPYRQDLEKEVLSYLSRSSLADGHTRIIAETAKETECGYLSGFGFALLKEKTYKTNKHIFIAKGENQDADSNLSGKL